MTFRKNIRNKPRRTTIMRIEREISVAETRLFRNSWIEFS
jgi:hypothetical protein